MIQLSDLKEIKKSILVKLNKANIYTIQDLLLHFPKNYKDKGTVIPIGETIDGIKQQISGNICQVNITNFRKKHLKCYFSDNTGMCQMHLFNFYPNQTKLLRKGNAIKCFGEIKHTNYGIEIIHPEWEIINEENQTVKCTKSSQYTQN